MNYSYFLRAVSEFNAAFRYKQPEPVTPNLDDAATNELRPLLIKEELLKLKSATTRVDQLDALCDIQYVLSGAVLAWGYRQYMENSRPTITLRKIRDYDGHLATMLGLNEQMGMAASRQFEAQVFSFLGMLQDRLTMLVWHLGFTPVFMDAFAEVHRSNMSKLWTAVEIHQSNESFDYEPTGSKYIARRVDGKIIKSPSYSPADLGRFVQ